MYEKREDNISRRQQKMHKEYYFVDEEHEKEKFILSSRIRTYGATVLDRPNC